MLDAFRKRTNNLAFSFLILLIVAVMAFFGMDSFNANQGRRGGAAARVNGEIITQDEFHRMLQGQLQALGVPQGQLDEKLIYSLGLPQRALNQLVQQRLVSQSAHEMGFRVPDAELATHIRSLPYLQVNGKFDAKRYSQIPRKGLFEKGERRALRSAKFQEYFFNRIKLSPTQLQTHASLASVKLNVRFAEIDFAALAAKYQPTATEIAAFLETTQTSALQQYYEQNKSKYRVPAKYKVRQIRVGFPFQATAEKKAAAKKKIDAATKGLTKDNFATVAKSHSDDEYAQRGGERGWVNASDLPPALAAIAKDLPVGQLSPVTEALGGYYVLQLSEKQPETSKPLKEVETSVAAELLKEQHRTEFETKMKARWNKILVDGGRIDGELKKYSVELKQTGAFALDARDIPQIGPGDNVWEQLLKLNAKGQRVNQLVLSNNKYYYLELTSVSRSSVPKGQTLLKSGEEVQSQLQNEFLTEWIKRVEKDSDIDLLIDVSTPSTA